MAPGSGRLELKGAQTIGEFFTALVITLFVLAAEVLEGMSVSRGRKAIVDHLDFLPRSASVRRASGCGEALSLLPGRDADADGNVNQAARARNRQTDEPHHDPRQQDDTRKDLHRSHGFFPVQPAGRC